MWRVEYFRRAVRYAPVFVLIFLAFWGVYPASALHPCSFISSGKTLEQGTNFRTYGTARVLYIQLGTSFGLAITTIVYNRIATQGSLELHTTTGPIPLPQAQLAGYRAAQWTAFSFAMCGGFPVLLIHPSTAD